MTPDFHSKWTQSDFPDPGKPFSPKFVQNFAKMASQLSQLLRKGLTLTDNSNGGFVVLNMAHGVPVLVASPLQNAAPPKGIWPLACDTQPIPQLQISYTATINGVLTPAPTGYFWVTALYPLAEQFVQLMQTSPQTIATSAITEITFPSTPAKLVGTNITYDGTGVLTVKKAGRYRGFGTAGFAFNAAGGRFFSLLYNGVQRLSSMSPGNIDAGSVAIASLAFECNFAAGDNIQMTGFQESGGNLATIASTVNPCILSLAQSSNDPSLTANVTLFVAGA